MNTLVDKNKISPIERRILLCLFLLIVSTLPFSISFNSKAIVVFGIYNLWLWLKLRKVDRRDLTFFVANILTVVLTLIGLLNTDEFSTVGRFFETRTSLLVFPVLFLMTGTFWDGNMIRVVFIGFAGTIIISGLIMQGELLVQLLQDHKPLSLFFYWRNSNDALTERIGGVHPTYFSMYAVFSIAIIYQFLVHGRKFDIVTIVGYMLMTYLAVLTLHLASRVSLISLFVVLGILAGNSILQFKLRSLWVIIPLLAGGAYLMNLEIFAMTDRYRHPINSPFEKPPHGTHDDRVVAWYSSLQIIRENFLFGVGTGDATRELNRQYHELGEEFFAEINLNSHNQFLDSFIRNGILGFASLVILYLFGFLDCRFRDLLYGMFVVVILLTSFTENILDRQQGDVFWCVFNVLLYRYSKASRDLSYTDA